jgi:hypothetical protein
MGVYTTTLILTLANAVATGIAASQSGTANTGLLINGSLASGGVATMDVARRVIITSAGNDSSITFTIVGTDRYGRPQSETVTGANTPTVVQSVKDYLTVTSITPSGNTASTVTAGTNQVASTAPYIADYMANQPYAGCTLTGTLTWDASVEIANDDLAPAWDVTNNPPTWTAPSAFSGKSSTVQGQVPGPFTMIRLTSVSFTNGTNQAVMTAKINLPFGVGPI